MTEEELEAYRNRQIYGLSAKPAKPERKPFKLDAYVPLEDDEQAALAKYLNLLANQRKDFRWAHVPNGGDRDVRVAARLKAHGVKRGVPDVLIFSVPPKYPDAKGVAIELKRRHGGVVSEDQEEWLAHLTAQGWCCYVAKGWEEAVKFMKELGY
jgi:hypothetical protein